MDVKLVIGAKEFLLDYLGKSIGGDCHRYGLEKWGSAKFGSIRLLASVDDNLMSEIEEDSELLLDDEEDEQIPNNQDESNPTDSPPWKFFKDPEGRVLFTFTDSEGNIVPLFGFLNPETYKEFVDYTNRAFEEFVPSPVRAAMAVLDGYSDQEDINESGNRQT